jgi:glycosyltransferase involved in cell wall biosynthesis
MQQRHVTLVGNTGWNIVRFRSELITGLLDSGWRVSAIAAFSDKQQEQITRLGAIPVHIELDAAGKNPWRDMVYLGQLAASLRRLGPDLVHLFTIKPLVYGALAARAAGVPGTVASVTGAGILGGNDRGWLGAGLRALVRFSLSGRSQVIFQNSDDQRAFIAKRLVHASQATAIPGSGVDTEALIPDRVTPPTRRKTFIMAARMLWSKGVADFVKAAQLVQRQHPDARFVLFGGTSDDYGSKNPDFIDRAWLESVQAEGVVEWRGWTEPTEVEVAMRKAGAVVLPSYYAEGVPRTLIEAAAAGAPIITTDLPGCRDAVIEGRSGFLVPPRSPESLAAAMIELLKAPERIAAMSEAARELALAQFDRKKVVAQTLEVYKRALGSRKAPSLPR